MVEGLVASLIISVCIAGVMRLWFYTSSMTQDVDHTSVGYSLVRQGVEVTKATGFWYTAEGTATLYYDQNGANESKTASGQTYKMVTTVTSSSLETQNGVTRPSDNAIRTVVVVVSRVSTGEELSRSGTFLVRGGL
jgi:Tfp pilus assembly protein PilV